MGCTFGVFNLTVADAYDTIVDNFPEMEHVAITDDLISMILPPAEKSDSSAWQLLYQLTQDKAYDFVGPLGLSCHPSSSRAPTPSTPLMTG